MPRGTKYHLIKTVVFETLLENTEAEEFSEGLSCRIGMRVAPELDAWRLPAGRALSSAGCASVADVLWFARLHPSFTSLPDCFVSTTRKHTAGSAAIQLPGTSGTSRDFKITLGCGEGKCSRTDLRYLRQIPSVYIAQSFKNKQTNKGQTHNCALESSL